MVFICGGCWNKEMVTELLHHLALFYPKLKYFRVSEQTREIANFVMDGLSKKREISDVLNGLSQNCLFIARFKDKLDHTGFDNCNLNVEDARRLILDIKSNIFGNTRSRFVVYDDDGPSSTTYSATIKYWMVINERRTFLEQQEHDVPSLVEQNPNPLTLWPLLLEHA